MTDEPRDPIAQTGIDTTIPHSARIWNYWLGGKDNYAVDRAAGDVWIAVQPEITTIAQTSRAFLKRAVTYLAAEAGIRQFLDVGTGLPTAENTHEVAQSVAPDARIVYVDHDPLVLAHARALLTSTPQGATRYIDADMRDTATILSGAAEILDLTRPVALLFMGVLGHVTDHDAAHSLVRSLLDALPTGSYLVIFDGAEGRAEGDAGTRAEDDYTDTGAMPYVTRTTEQVATFFDGLEWVEPGYVSAPLWRPAHVLGIAGTTPQAPEWVNAFAGVARKSEVPSQG